MIYISSRYLQEYFFILKLNTLARVTSQSVGIAMQVDKV